MVAAMADGIFLIHKRNHLRDRATFHPNSNAKFQINILKKTMTSTTTTTTIHDVDDKKKTSNKQMKVKWMRNRKKKKSKQPIELCVYVCGMVFLRFDDNFNFFHASNNICDHVLLRSLFFLFLCWTTITCFYWPWMLEWVCGMRWARLKLIIERTIEGNRVPRFCQQIMFDARCACALCSSQWNIKNYLYLRRDQIWYSPHRPKQNGKQFADKIRWYIYLYNVLSVHCHSVFIEK